MNLDFLEVAFTYILMLLSALISLGEACGPSSLPYAPLCDLRGAEGPGPPLVRQVVAAHHGSSLPSDPSWSHQARVFYSHFLDVTSIACHQPRNDSGAKRRHPTPGPSTCTVPTWWK